MKKVLFATTALIATASMAAAEVRISGYGRFGLDYNDGNSRTVANQGPGCDTTAGVCRLTPTTNVTSRLRLQFDMSAETDSGVAFGARFRAQAESRGGIAGGATFNGARFFATYEGFTVGVGNIIGAVENTPGFYLETRTAGIGMDGAGFVSNVGNVNGEYFNWDSYSSAGAGVNGVEALYTAGGFTGHISWSARNGATRTGRVAAMVTYSWNDWTASLSGQSSDFAWEDKWVLTVQGNLGNFGVRAAYADNDGIGKWGLYGNYDIGAASNILAYVTSEDSVSATQVAAGRNDNRDSVVGSNQQAGTSYGLHYHYDLGGGASFETGYRRGSDKNNTFQAGVYFSF